jgi:hypothetical protein
MGSGLSLLHFIDRCGGLEEFLKLLRDIGHGQAMYKLAKAKGMDPSYVSRVLNEYVESWEPKLKPAARDTVDMLIAEHKEFYDDARRALTGEGESAEVIPVDFRPGRR